MSKLQEKTSNRMNIDEFNELPEDNSCTYEFIDGELVMQSRPSFKHQKILGKLYLKIYNYLNSGSCEIFIEVELDIDGNVIVPDLSIFCNLKLDDIQRTVEPPTLVVEIVSPSNSAMEMNIKMNKYRSHGINEYWLVDPKSCCITIYNLKNDTAMTYIKSGLITSTAFPDLEIKLSDIFE